MNEPNTPIAKFNKKSPLTIDIDNTDTLANFNALNHIIKKNY